MSRKSATSTSRSRSNSLRKPLHVIDVNEQELQRLDGYEESSAVIEVDAAFQPMRGRTRKKRTTADGEIIAASITTAKPSAGNDYQMKLDGPSTSAAARAALAAKSVTPPLTLPSHTHGMDMANLPTPKHVQKRVRPPRRAAAIAAAAVSAAAAKEDVPKLKPPTPSQQLQAQTVLDSKLDYVMPHPEEAYATELRSRGRARKLLVQPETSHALQSYEDSNNLDLSRRRRGLKAKAPKVELEKVLKHVFGEDEDAASSSSSSSSSSASNNNNNNDDDEVEEMEVTDITIGDVSLNDLEDNISTSTANTKPTIAKNLTKVPIMNRIVNLEDEAAHSTLYKSVRTWLNIPNKGAKGWRSSQPQANQIREVDLSLCLAEPTLPIFPLLPPPLQQNEADLAYSRALLNCNTSVLMADHMKRWKRVKAHWREHYKQCEAAWFATAQQIEGVFAVDVAEQAKPSIAMVEQPQQQQHWPEQQRVEELPTGVMINDENEVEFMTIAIALDDDVEMIDAVEPSELNVID